VQNVTVIQVKKSIKGNTPSNNKESSGLLNDNHQDTVPVFIAVVREAPNQIFANVLLHTEQTLKFDTKPGTPSSTSQAFEKDFLRFYSKMRGVSTRNLPTYLSWYRMLHLLHAVNPRILAEEMFKLCLNKDTLSHSRRLIKKLI
jgi:hypothetical protein